jgi:2-polyprenyl-3-methyl-5-hydroxy-6-metoxy-1,4-benzoquinol methylase
MNLQDPDQDLEKIRQQFDQTPYPRIPLETSPKGRHELLYIHNLVTSYYLRYRTVIDTKGKLILDAGCGSGYKSLVLAEANPGARIVGIDLSEESVKLAYERLKYHGFENAEFHPLLIEDLPKLGMQFDYINCDEVLYLLPDPLAGLQAMKSVLKPDGLLRANLHNAYQRAPFYRAQALFKFAGLMDHSPQETETEIVVETMTALKEQVRLKRESWGKNFREHKDQESLMSHLFSNHLLLGDKGFTMPELFELLDQADLDFVSMVDWRHWEVTDLFEEPDNLPAFWGMSLATASIQEKLQIYELFNPVHRLMDFWCTHPGEAGVSVDDWQETDWQGAIAHLHPQLCNETLKEALLTCITTTKPFEISQQVQMPAYGPVLLESTIAACLLPLWDKSQPIEAIAQRYQTIHPVDPLTLAPISPADAVKAVKNLLNRLDAFLYVLLEKR